LDVVEKEFKNDPGHEPVAFVKITGEMIMGSGDQGVDPASQQVFHFCPPNN